MKSFLKNNNIEIYSTHNKEKSVVPERFIRTLNNKTYKYMISLSKNVYIDKLDEIMNKYSNKYKIIKMKPLNVKSSIYFDFNKENNRESPKFKVGDHIKISKYKNRFCKRLCSKLVWRSFFITKVKNAVPWTYVISDLKYVEIVGTFYEKELQKANQKEFRVEKLIKRKDDKLYVK